MERFVITLQQAERLKELGFEADFTFWWSLERDAEIGLYYKLSEWANPDKSFRAYHVGELGEILRDWVLGIDPEFIEGDKVWFITNNEVPDRVHPTEAQARGALLIYLLEMKLI